MTVYRFEPFAYCSDRLTLTLGGDTVEIRPKTARLLECFLEHPGALLSKEDLLTRVWDDVTVGEAVVFQTLSELRKIFAELRPGEEVVQTIKGRGYRWVHPSPVEIERAAPAPGASRPAFGRRLAPWAAASVLVPILGALLYGALLYGLADRSDAVASHVRTPGEPGEQERILLLADPLPDDPASSAERPRGLLRMVERVLGSTGRLEVVIPGEDHRWFLEVAEAQGSRARAAAHFGGFLGTDYVVFSRWDPPTESAPSEGARSDLEFFLFRDAELVARETLPDLPLLQAAERLAARVTELLGIDPPTRQVSGSFSNDPRALDAFALGEQAQARGEMAIAATLYEKALAYDDDFLWARAALARVYEARGEVDRAEETIRRVLIGARVSEDYFLEVECLHLLASKAIRDGAWETLLDYQRQIHQAAWRWGDRRVEAEALRLRGSYHYHLQQWPEAAEAYRAGLRLAEQAGDRLAAAHSYNNLGAIALRRDDLPAAREALQKALDHYTQTGRRWFLAGPMANLGLVERDLGRLDQARRLLEEALALTRESGNPAFTARILSSLGMLFHQQGLHDEAVPRLREAFGILDRIRDQEGRSTVAFNLSQVYLDADRPNEVPPLLQLCAEQWQEREPHLFVLWAQYHHQRGERARAVESMEKARTLYGDGWDEELAALLQTYRGETYRPGAG